MPDPVLDELRIPAISLTVEELDERRRQISRGELPSDWMDRYRKALADNVFGSDHQRDSAGRSLEQGVGAKGHETANHFAALRRAEHDGYEQPGAWAAAVAELWKRDPERARSLNLPQQRQKA